jgi:putative transposase
LKSGFSQSVTDVAEGLGVHRVTVQRWLKQYNAGGRLSLLKIQQLTGRALLNSNRRNRRNIKKTSEESCEFNNYK